MDEILQATGETERALGIALGWNKPVDLAGVVYGGMRVVTFVPARSAAGGATGKVTEMFAVSIPTDDGIRDLMLCRRPELAKLLVKILKGLPAADEQTPPLIVGELKL